MITIRQGESFRIPMNLRQDGSALVPEQIEDIKICIADSLTKTWKNEGIKFDYEKNQWYIFPTQQETLNMKKGTYSIFCHVKYPDSSVIIAEIGSVKVLEGCCKEVF